MEGSIICASHVLIILFPMPYQLTLSIWDFQDPAQLLRAGDS